MPERALLIVDDTTTAADLAAFLIARARPLACAGSIVYDFNNHPFDSERFAASDLPPGRYVVPFSMSEINVDLFALLPAPVAALPRLRLNPRAETGGYTALPSLIPVDPAAERRLRAAIEVAFAEAGHD